MNSHYRNYISVANPVQFILVTDGYMTTQKYIIEMLTNYPQKYIYYTNINIYIYIYL